MFTHKELTFPQKNAWMETKTMFQWKHAPWTHIWRTMLDNSGTEHGAVFTLDVPTAAADGTNLIFNPDFFFARPIGERIFIMGHEIGHGIFDHPRTFTKYRKIGFITYADGFILPFIEQYIQWAGDYFINDMLIESKIGTYNKDWLWDRCIGTQNQSVVDIYRNICAIMGVPPGKKPPPGGNPGHCPPGKQPGQGNGPPVPGKAPGGQQGLDEVIEPGATFKSKDGSDAPAPDRNNIKWESAIATAAELARQQALNGSSQGKALCEAMARMLDKINEPVIDWSDKFHGAFTRKVGNWRYNWKKPDRRLITRDIIAPSKSRYGAGDIFIGGDSSGSMTQKEMSMALGIVAGVLDQVAPRRLAVIWCDNQIRRVDEIEDIFDLERIQKEGTSGWGGTDFRPVFDWIRDNTDEVPSALIYFTDGDGDFPSEKPDYPVFWCNIKPGQKYPFGDVIDVPVAAYKKD